jgi:transcriptional regulator of nitric oxide reductase
MDQRGGRQGRPVVVLERTRRAVFTSAKTVSTMRRMSATPEDHATGRRPAPPAPARPRKGEHAATNAQLLGHLEALRAEVAELRRGQGEIRQALGRLG